MHEHDQRCAASTNPMCRCSRGGALHGSSLPVHAATCAPPQSQDASSGGRDHPSQNPTEPSLADVLDADMRQAFCAIRSSLLGRCFYLAGDTGLALQIGHRRSEDLDYFIHSDRLDRRFVQREMARAFREGQPKLELSEPTQMDWRVGTAQRKLSFIAYPFAPVDPFRVVDGQEVASPREIALMKAYVLGRRATARDYVDLEALLSSGEVSLAEIVERAKTKFVIDGESVFSQRLFIAQLVWSEDLRDVDELVRVGYDPARFPETMDRLRRIVRCFTEEMCP